MKKVDEVFNINEDLEDEVQEVITIVPEKCTFDKEDPDNDIIEDYVFIRKKLRYGIAASEKVFELALRDLSLNPSPRVVEGCSTIIKTITECTNQLLTVHEKLKKMKPCKDSENDEKNSGGGGDKKKTKIKATVNEIIQMFEDGV